MATLVSCRRTGRSPAGGTTPTARARPPPGPSLRSPRAASHTCGLKTDGTLACWGDNVYGQSTPPAGTFTRGRRRRLSHLRTEDGRDARLLGLQRLRPEHAPRRDLHSGRRRRLPHLRTERRTEPSPAGATTPTARARRPPGPSLEVTAGIYHTCGLKTDGTLACWGDNSDGQSTPPAGTFTQVAGGSQPHVRTEDGRDARLLGGQLLRPEHAPQPARSLRSPGAASTRAE